MSHFYFMAAFSWSEKKGERIKTKKRKGQKFNFQFLFQFSLKAKPESRVAHRRLAQQVTLLIHGGNYFDV